MAGKQRQDDLLVEGIARGLSVSQAAINAGCSPRTAFRRKQEPGFQAKIREARSAMFETATGRLTGLMTRAAETLRKLLRDPAPSIRLNAAKCILETATKLRESVDIEERIFELERIAEQRK